ncbi:carbohydrate ABC transporter permease [Dictyobacter formicarum]|uniref:ABC transporter permease n=1 Tax=Dictyobacter formicarum TaxID=2778368 RepID=A0ABQ3V8W8_9CHLR|nr:carbohydrate ABC transporter permease [Dictyobacter formicarum]GHO82103.1 ABC transporter permease [Dictyobacter formicarum]
MAVAEQVGSKEHVQQAHARIAAKKRMETVGKVVRYVAVVIIVFISLAPLYWTFATSVKNGIEINQSPPTIFPHQFDFNNYVQVLTNSTFFLPTLRNSTIIATITTLLALVFGILCAYALGRMKFRGKPFVLATVLSVQMFPFIALIGPLFVLFTGPLYLYNTYWALIIADLVLNIPLVVWFLTSFFRDLPPDLEEAARIDGASRLKALWYVIMPLTAPGIFSSAILSFIAVWNDFLFGLNLTSDESAQPVTVGITRFNSEHVVAYGQLAAAAIIVTIPLVIIVLFLQRRIVSGLTAGAVKG